MPLESFLFKWLKSTSCPCPQPRKKNHILLDRSLSENFTIKMNGNIILSWAVSIMQVAHTVYVVIPPIILWLFGTFDSLKVIIISFSGETYFDIN